MNRSKSSLLAFLNLCFGRIAGFLFEGIWYVIYKGHWESHFALVWGPLCVFMEWGTFPFIWKIFLYKKVLRCIFQ